MHTMNSVLIRGNAERIFALASAVERWPEILPHYREVRVLDDQGDERLVSMHCVRTFGALRWPCKWQAKQKSIASEHRILFTHVRGPVRGMKVEWKLRPSADGVETTISHDLEGRGLLSPIFSRFIGPVFISSIAGQTLSRIKELVERGVAE